MSFMLRQAPKVAQNATRAFTTSAAARADIVQQLYIKELKSYKPAPAAKDAHVGQVRSWSAPQKPAAPALPTDLAAELSAYDAAEPTLASAPAAGEAPAAASAAEEFLEMLEADPVVEEHEHH
ncbi:hypothetical protein K523DRAFT_255015 [Schizophyllum commune Tattone D]|nr:hypothetical protein K523DRAFT_255015 [Schizophyllum commune Tattone D]